MKFTTLSLAAAAIGLCFSACSNDNTVESPVEPATSGQPAGFHISISEPATRANQEGNSTADETKFTTADIFIYADNVLTQHVRLLQSDFTLTGDHIWTSDDPIISTTGSKEIYAALNMPENLGKAIAATKNKTGLYLLSNTDSYPLIDATDGFVMFSTKPATATLLAQPADNIVTVSVGRLMAKVTVQKATGLQLVLENEGTLDNLEFAIRNSNKLYWPYQKKESGIVYDPNWKASEWADSQFNQAAASEYVEVDEDNTGILDRKVKYTPENTSEETLTRETTYASVRAQFIPENFYDEDGNPTPNTALKSFWVVTIDETGEAYYFDNLPTATAFAADKGTVSDEYKQGYCYYNLFLNPSNDFQTLRNTLYQLRITSINGLGNPNPQDEGDTDKPVTRPANITIVVDIEPWTVISDNYDLF